MSIYEFIDYRVFLKNLIEKLPKKGRGEINRIAQFAEVHPSLLSQILAGDKNLNLEQAQLVAEYLGLAVQENEFFMMMVQLQRAGTVKLRNYFRQKLNDLKQTSMNLSQRVRQDQTLTEEEKSVFYSHWLYIAIWLFTSLQSGRSLDEICKEFRISRERASSILNFLIETQICKLEKGRYQMGSQSIHLERSSAHLTKHHTNWRLRSIEASDQISEEELMYSAPMSLSKADFQKLRQRLADVIKEVTEVAIPSPAEDIACFNLDFFWLRR